MADEHLAVGKTGDRDALFEIGLGLVGHSSIGAKILRPLPLEYFLLRGVGLDE
jgi:hypothetical protein